MSRIDAAISNEMVIPRVSAGELFAGREDTPFAIGMLSVGEDVLPGRDDLYRGYLTLRARVYADQTRMIPQDEVRDDGTEVDVDDARSVHWGIFEADAVDSETARVVGAIRVIKKTAEDPRPLPIEDFFSDAFEAPVPVGATEVSRYIARHENRNVQRQLSPVLFSAVVGHINSRDLGPTFGVVEPRVERHLKALGVPLERIAEPKFVPEYAADNLGFEVDIPLLGTYMGINPKNVRATEQDFAYFQLQPKSATVVA